MTKYLLIPAMLLSSYAKAMESNFVMVEPECPTPLVRSIEVDLGSIDTWDQAIFSWEAVTPGNSSIKLWAETETNRFLVAEWSEAGMRTSAKPKKAGGEEFSTDTFIKSPSKRPLKLVAEPVLGENGEVPMLERLYANFTLGAPPTSYAVPDPVAPLEVPMRCQGNYPGGGVLCSPTSVSMVLSYWAKVLDRPEIDADVPIVQKGVYDPEWGGTGNWPFNTAYAGSRPGMQAYVTRLRGIEDAEAWLRKGVPVVCSVAYGLLKGKPERDPNDGHLVVLVGFDDNGNAIFNDPGRSAVRLLYPVRDFVRAWASSRNTVYMIYPKYWQEPRVLGGPWRQRS